MTNKEYFIKNGYLIIHNFLNNDELTKLRKLSDNISIAMGETWNNEYIPNLEKNKYMHYWSDTVRENNFVKNVILKKIKPFADDFFGKEKYVQQGADFKITNPGSTYIYPHFDTPYRHDKWANKFDNNILGMQFGIALDEFNTTSGATKFLPNSHKKIYYKKDMDAGKHTQELIDKGISFETNPGGLLLYHSRIMHSTMPNKSNKPRRLLLCLHLSKNIIDEVIEVESAL